jgi:hydrogenase expression/formation protein
VVPPKAAERVISVIRKTGVAVAIIGRAEEGPAESILFSGGVETDFSPQFREAAYTPLKKVVEKQGGDFEEMKRKVDHAADAAREKKQRMLKRLL